jgi:ribosomal protein S27AE
MSHPNFKCPKCGSVSYNLNDIAQGYCGRCHEFTRDQVNQFMKSRGRYILNEQGEPVPEPNFLKLAAWMETANLHVADETINGVRVSTVFLCIDHNYRDNDTPILWETMIFGGAYDQQCKRCGGSREQAEAMHREMCAHVLSASGVKSK